jgi:hypothetical protein
LPTPKIASITHDNRKTNVSASRGVRGFVFTAARYIGQPESGNLTSESPSPFEDVDLALLRFVRSLVQFGLTPGEAGAVVSAELERAEALASKRRPRRYWISGPYLVSGPAELRARA